MNELFQAFAKNEYWSIRGLIELTNQPMLYLKELLVDIAILIKRGPHLGTYQLKQEFKPANTVIKLE